jgi:hypothetical protein
MTTLPDMQDLKRKLHRLQARNLTEMGYEAKMQHQRKVAAICRMIRDVAKRDGIDPSELSLPVLETVSGD